MSEFLDTAMCGRFLETCYIKPFSCLQFIGKAVIPTLVLHFIGTAWVRAPVVSIDLVLLCSYSICTTSQARLNTVLLNGMGLDSTTMYHRAKVVAIDISSLPVLFVPPRPIVPDAQHEACAVYVTITSPSKCMYLRWICLPISHPSLCSHAYQYTPKDKSP